MGHICNTSILQTYLYFFVVIFLFSNINSESSLSTLGPKSLDCHCANTGNDRSDLSLLRHSSPSRNKHGLSATSHSRKIGSAFQQEFNLPPNVGISRKLSKFAKEKKAAKTLGTVMGIFIICWLPFFITNVISGVCGQLKIECIGNPQIVFPTLTWLGWLNSCMNPFIYACCSQDFRR